MAMQPSQAAQPMNAPRMSNDKFQSQVKGIGDLLRRNQVSAQGKETKDVKRVDEAYKSFLDQVKDQDSFMKRATDEQKEVFAEIFQEFTKLRKDSKVDFDRSHKEFTAAVARLHEVGGDDEVKSRLEQIAATGMKFTDKQKKGGVINQEITHRMDKMFGADKDDLASPLFRKLAGLDKKDKLITPLEAAQNLGKAEAIKKTVSDDITGDAHRDAKADAMAAEMTGKGKGGGAFPTKIENLHVENLIVKSVRRAEDEKSPRYMQGAIGGPEAGKSAVAVHPMLPAGPGGAGAHVVPALPAPHDPHGALIEYRPHEPLTPQLEHHQPNLLPAPKLKNHHDAEDVEFREHEPIKVKPRNPHAPLKTKESPLASAVRGAVDSGEFMKPTGTVVDAIKPSELASNDIGNRDSSSTIKDDEAIKPAEDDGGSLIPTAITAASALLGGKKNKGGEEKEKGVKEKTKGTGEEEGVKTKGTGEEGLAKEGRALAGEAKAGSKVLKGISKIGKVAGIASVALTAYNSYGEYSSADDELKKGKITAQQAKEQKAHAVGGGLGSVIGGWAGSAIGGIAGSLVAPGVGTLAGGAAGGYLGSQAGEWVGDKIGSWWAKPSEQTGNTLHALNSEKADASNKPTVIVAPAAPSVNSGVSAPVPVPVSNGSRSRESYFDRQMMQSFVK